MVRPVKREEQKQGDGSAPPLSFPPPPPEGSSIARIIHWSGQYGVILVLFETPSGFALLRYDGTRLFRTGALEDIWVHFTDEERANSVVFLEGFKIFNDKSLAINVETGLSEQFTDFIVEHHLSGQKIAVGKLEYKKIIEEKLKIHCLYNDAVLELMWGLKHIMKSLVPDEKCELTKEDRCYMSKGMQLILNRYDFKVNEDMIIIAATLYECDYSVNRFAEYLHRGDKHLQSVSGISSEDWDLQRLAAALKLICYPEEKIETGVSNEMLSEEMAKTLVADAHKYEDLLHKGTCLDIYREILWVRAAKSRALTLLESSIKKAKAMGKKSHINIVAIGHVDCGKSTT